MMAKGRSTTNADVIIVQKSPIKAAFAEVFSRKRALAIGTGVGSIIGLIPGVGGQIAGLVAYDQSKKFSPERDKFGTGHSEGVIAAEAANNAMVGPSLVPLLTLSIPGSPTAAVLLGGLLIHGIFPGTDLFDNHPDVAWTFINSMLIGQVLMCIFGLYVAGLAASVASVPHSVMAAIVLGLAVFGSYSIQNSYSDVVLMLVLGSLMYVLNKYGFSAAPIVLGIILGPIAEDNFSMGKMIAEVGEGVVPYFMTGPINLVLIFICLVSIGYSVWVEVKQRRAVTSELKRSTPGTRVAAVGAVAASLVVLTMVMLADGTQAYDFPFLLAILMMLFAALLLIDVLRTWSRQKSGPGLVEWSDLGVGIVVIVGYLILLQTAGFYSASWIAFTAIVMLYTVNKNRQQVIRILWVSVGFMAAIYGLFNVSLRVITPGLF